MTSPNNPSPRLSVRLSRLAARSSAASLSLSSLLERGAEAGHLMLILLLAAPFLVPVTIPGMSVPFGLLIALTAAQAIRGRPPWLPPWLARTELSPEKARALLSRSARMLRWFERFARPRLTWLLGPRAHQFLFGGVLFSGILLALPLPPPTNFLPAVAVILFSLAAARRDALCAAAGCLALLLNAYVLIGILKLVIAIVA